MGGIHAITHALTLSHAIPLANSFLKTPLETFLTFLISVSRMQVEERFTVAVDICLHPRAAWSPAGRGGILRSSKQVQVLLVQLSQHMKTCSSLISSTWGAVLTTDAALALPTLLNPSSPCQNLSHLLQAVIKNNTILFANHGYNVGQKCSLDSLKKNNQFQTI